MAEHRAAEQAFGVPGVMQTNGKCVEKGCERRTRKGWLTEFGQSAKQRRSGRNWHFVQTLIETKKDETDEEEEEKEEEEAAAAARRRR